jgi:hypothetical protein
MEANAAEKTRTIQETSFTVFKNGSFSFTSTTNPEAVITLPPLSTLSRYNEASGFWSPRSFSQSLVLPTLSADSPPSTMLLTFDAMCSGDLVVCLSPSPDFVLGKSYAAVFGSQGNSLSILRRRAAPSGLAAPPEVSAACKPCDSRRWVSYWLSLSSEGVLSLGVLDPDGGSGAPSPSLAARDAANPFPASNCLLQFVDKSYAEQRQPEDAVRFVAFGNNQQQPPGARAGGGRGGGAAEVPSTRIRNVTLRQLTAAEDVLVLKPRPPSSGAFQVRTWEEAQGLSESSSGAARPFSEEMHRAMMEEWEKEMAARSARAEKYGTDYKIPAFESFLKWSEAKYLSRQNGSQGFVTGIDMDDPEEVKKREARFAKFGAMLGGSPATPAPSSDGSKKRSRDGEEDDASADAEKATAEIGGAGTPSADSVQQSSARRGEARVMPVTGAFACPHFQNMWRVDPEPTAVFGSEEAGAMDTSVKRGEWGMGDVPHLIPEKLHIFSFDFSAFLQMTTADILAHFSVYGPSYVEWLGETSCNVIFEDAFSAKRAFMNLCQAIPSPEEVEALEAEKAPASASKPVTHVTDGVAAAVAAAAPTGASDVDVDVDGDGDGDGDADASVDISQVSTSSSLAANASPPRPALGALGWRYCRSALVKSQDDRKGRKGSRARFLARFATSADALEKKGGEQKSPAGGGRSKPPLPKGWSKDVVYGPGGAKSPQRSPAPERGGGGGGARTGKRSKSEGGSEPRQQQQHQQQRESRVAFEGGGARPFGEQQQAAAQPVNRLDMPLSSGRPAEKARKPVAQAGSASARWGDADDDF